MEGLLGAPCLAHQVQVSGSESKLYPKVCNGPSASWQGVLSPADAPTSSQGQACSPGGMDGGGDQVSLPV